MASTPVNPTPSTPKEDCPDPGGIREVKEGVWSLDRATLDKTLSRMDCLSRSVRIIPHFDNGHSMGFKIFGVQPDRLAAKLGFKNGDILVSINDMVLTGPDKALEAFSRIRTASKVKVKLRRRGQDLLHEYIIE